MERQNPGQLDEWREHAACKGQPLDIFFPHDNSHADRARSFCDTCHVTAECLQAALQNREQGFWAGTSEDDRAPLLARRVAWCKWCGNEFPFTAASGAPPGFCSNAHRTYSIMEQKRLSSRKNHSGAMLAKGHGKISKYVNGCRCPACKVAQREYKRTLRARGAA